MKTRRIILTLALIVIAFLSQAQHYKADGTLDRRYKENKSRASSSYSMPTSTPAVRYQNAYQRKDGTVVQSHKRTVSNTTNTDNFSTKGNTNTYTGVSGSRARDYSGSASNYGGGQKIQTGSRGGQYYINKNGNKTYVPKR